MAKTQKEIPIHHDLLGKEITIGSYVVAAKNTLYVCKVTKLNPKMVKVLNIKSIKGAEWLLYPREMIVVDGPDVVAYILKNAK